MPPHNASSWKELILRLGAGTEICPPGDESRYDRVEKSLEVGLPMALREFLTESDGLKDEYGFGVIWSVDEIERRNREFRTIESFRELYMPFDNMLFFGEDGGGDLFAFAIHADGRIHKDDIFRWEHESDGRSWFAARLEQFIERRLTDEE